MKMKITLLGVEGCPTCAQLDTNVQQAISDYGRPVTVEKVTDPEAVMNFAPGGLPAVIINGDQKSVRRVPTVLELKGWLENA